MLGVTMSKKAIAVIAVIVISAAVLAVLNLDKIIVYYFAKTNGLDVGYSGIRWQGLDGLVLGDLRVTEKKSGLGLYSSSAVVRLAENRTAGGMVIDFDMKDTNFISAAPSEGAFGDVTGLVAGAFSDKVKYVELSGRLSRFGDTLKIERLTATGDLMKLDTAGTINGSGGLSLDCTIFFSDQIKSRIPKELSDVILKEEQGKWPSLTVHIEGDYRAPSINVSGRRFRLNIRQAAGI